MRSPLARAAALLVLTLLAGCTSDAPAGEADPDAVGANATMDLTAVNETPAAAEAAAVPEAHAHDLWRGETRITRLDADVAPEALTTGEIVGRFPALDGLVLEGTGAVEVLAGAPKRHFCSAATVNDFPPCTPAADDPSPSTTLRLEYRDATSTAWNDLGAVTWDAPVVIPVTVESVDMPHSGTSLWEFRVVSTEPMDSTVTFRAKVDIVRGDGDIPLWPGHLEFYAPGKEEREVLRAAGRTEVAPDTLGSTTYREEQAVPVEGLVSFGTRSLVVLVNITKLESPPGTEPTSWDLYYANATGGWNWTRGEPGETLRFVIPVEESAMDSPYLESSRWKLVLTGDVRVTAPRAYVQGPGMQYVVEYDVVAIASSLPPEAYADAVPGGS